LGGKDVRLRVDSGTRYIIKRKPSAASTALFSVERQGKFELSAPSNAALIIDGGAEWPSGNPAAGNTETNTGIAADEPLIYIEGDIGDQGMLRLKNGVFLQNNDRKVGMGNGGAIQALGSFEIEGGVITGNRADNGGGIFVGTDHNNYSIIHRISGGTITKNTARHMGGGLILDLNGQVSLQMLGGIIEENRAVSRATLSSAVCNGFGGGIFIPGPNMPVEFDMRGGIIRNNVSASGFGNGVAMDYMWYPPSVFTMRGSAQITGNDVYLAKSDCFITIGGTLTASRAANITLEGTLASGVSQKILEASNSGMMSANYGKFSAAPYNITTTGNTGYARAP
jgi:hypothetical protein